ncbi:MAG: hypothetical protein GY851_01270 [bacterium]|nr:hypothetical protein [bacterium]
MNELWLAFEGGGTKTRILLSDTQCNVIARELGGSASPLYIRRAQYARKIRSMLKRLRKAADDAGGQVSTVGLGGPMAVDLVQDEIRAAFGQPRFVLIGESDIGYALYRLKHGISLVAGTGASARALTEDGRNGACGGFGPQFGDEGCGYWIGREAVAAAMRAMNGRGPATTLTDRLCRFYEVPRITGILRYTDHSGHVPGPKVASCVPEVFAAANEGDAVALGVCREAGRQLGDLVAAVADQAKFQTSPIPVVLTGGVFNGGPLILTSLMRVLRESDYEFHVHPPVPEPTMGVLGFLRMAREKENSSVSG